MLRTIIVFFITICGLASASGIVLKNGSIIVADQITEQGDTLIVHIGAQSIAIPRQLVESVQSDTNAVATGDKVRTVDPNRTRYLYSPSGFMLNSGEASVSQKELFFTTFAYGLTDHITFQLGSIVPLLFVDEGANMIGGIKAGFSPSELIHLAGGTQVLMTSEYSSFFPFATFTLGTQDAHISCNVSSVVNDDNSFGEGTLFSMSGLYRMNDQFALLSENMFFPNTFDLDTYGAYSLAGRIISGNLAVDIGLIVIPEIEIPIPWLDFTYHFKK